jgi:aryl-alcohol dehydrogenase-like predicted oxidoreductase
MINKIALGTVQFGLDYGINNPSRKTNQKEVNSILENAANIGITLLDTAIAYGDSEKTLGKSKDVVNGVFNIITKIVDTKKNAEIQLNESLLRLNQKSIYGLLAHNFSIVEDNPDFYQTMVLLKETGLVSKVGVSIYTPLQLNFLLRNKVDLDIVQLPYSVFDQRFAEMLPLLKERNIEVHVRSVFLQGLMFMKDSEMNAYFNPLLPYLHQLQDLAKKINVSISEIALIFASMNKDIDKVVIGCVTKEQLLQNINSLKKEEKVKQIYSELQNLSINDENMLLPYKWKL